jgi:hypothetical protein
LSIISEWWSARRSASQLRNAVGRSKRAIIVSSADENFFPLVKGFYLSLRTFNLPLDNIDLGFIDIGNGADVLRWLDEHGVVVRSSHEVDVAGYFGGKPQFSYVQGQYVRPFLPEFFPNYDFYLWMDSDVWIQEPSSLVELFDTASRFPDRVCLVPTVDVAYEKFYHNYFGYLDSYHRVYNICFDAQTADDMRGRAVLSSGGFALGRTSAIWEGWRQQLRVALATDYTDAADALHVAEQLALNVAAYRSGLFVPMEATHNFACHAGARIVRDAESGKVVSRDQRRRRIGVIHLADFPNEKTRYLENGLLWKAGAYLTPEERQAIMAYQRR